MGEKRFLLFKVLLFPPDFFFLSSFTALFLCLSLLFSRLNGLLELLLAVDGRLRGSCSFAHVNSAGESFSASRLRCLCFRRLGGALEHNFYDYVSSLQG